MFYPTEYLIEPFVGRLQNAYWRMYSHFEPDYAGLIAWVGRLALELIANTNALYHNVDHTIQVTLVGQEILRGKYFRGDDVSPRDWLHFVTSLLCHDIGYVRGVCRGDADGIYATGLDGETVTLSPGATDAALTPYHVDRSVRFARERFAGHDILDAELIAAHIERTRFPVPDDREHQDTADYPGLARAADLIGQLADPQRMRKLPALFYEFEETGTNGQLGYATPDDLLDDYPAFYWNVAHWYIQEGLNHLQMTQEGRQWIANLYAHVFAVEHRSSH